MDLSAGMNRQDRAAELVAGLERRGLRFKIDDEMPVVVTSSLIAPTELRQLVESLGGAKGTHENPTVAGVLLPYVLSVLKRRGDIETVALELRGALGWSAEHGWGSVTRTSDGELTFALLENRMVLQLPQNLVLVIPEEQLRSVHDAGTEPKAEEVGKPKRSFWDYFRGATSGKGE